jgi:hypothetical protein
MVSKPSDHDKILAVFLKEEEQTLGNFSMQDSDTLEDGTITGFTGELSNAGRDVIDDGHQICNLFRALRLKPETLVQFGRKSENNWNSWVVIGNIELGWAVKIDGNMGEYSDEECDATAGVEVVTRSPKAVMELVGKARGEYMDTFLTDFAEALGAVDGSMMPGETNMSIAAGVWKQLAEHSGCGAFAQMVGTHLTGVALEQTTPPSLPKKPGFRM